MRPITAAIALSIAASVTHARDYYVRPTGNDNGPGTAAEPLQTVTEGVYRLVAGDTLYIGAGIYNEGELYPDANGTPTNRITIRNIPGEAPILDGNDSLWNFIELIEKDGYEIRGLTLRHYYDQAISCNNVGYITIAECICHANGSAGIGLNYAAYPHAAYDAHLIVEDNICYENGWGIGWASGIHLNNKDEGVNTAHVIRRNICYNNYDGSSHHTDGNGIMFDMGAGGTCRIENNLCFNNGGAGIRAMDGLVEIINNTCYRNAWDPDNPYQPGEIELIERYRPGSITGSIVRNNAVHARPTRENDGAPYGGVFVYEELTPASFTFDHNILWSDDPSEIVVEPWMSQCSVVPPAWRSAAVDDTLTPLHGGTFLAMDAADYDFHLMPSSPAINAGSSAAAPADDLDMTPRPWSIAWDCGVYEYVADGDCDASGTVDLTDWSEVEACCQGPGPAPLSDCACGDLDGDGDVDLADMQTLQIVLHPS